jgi:hypothetical protein
MNPLIGLRYYPAPMQYSDDRRGMMYLSMKNEGKEINPHYVDYNVHDNTGRFREVPIARPGKHVPCVNCGKDFTRDKLLGHEQPYWTPYYSFERVFDRPTGPGDIVVPACSLHRLARYEVTVRDFVQMDEYVYCTLAVDDGDSYHLFASTSNCPSFRPAFLRHIDKNVRSVAKGVSIFVMDATRCLPALDRHDAYQLSVRVGRLLAGPEDLEEFVEQDNLLSSIVPIPDYGLIDQDHPWSE